MCTSLACECSRRKLRLDPYSTIRIISTCSIIHYGRLQLFAQYELHFCTKWQLLMHLHKDWCWEAIISFELNTSLQTSSLLYLSLAYFENEQVVPHFYCYFKTSLHLDYLNLIINSRPLHFYKPYETSWCCAPRQKSTHKLLQNGYLKQVVNSSISKLKVIPAQFISWKMHEQLIHLNSHA